MAQDYISKPLHGRYFPLSHAQLVSYVKTHGFAVHSYDDRLPVILENCDVECELGHQLCTFFRMGYLAELSLPDTVLPDLGRRAVEFALAQLEGIDKGPHMARHDQEFIVYRAYLGPLSLVSITRHIVKGGQRSYLKFRSASKLPKANRAPDHQQLLVSVHVA